MPFDGDRLRATQQLTMLLTDYWHDVDMYRGHGAPDYYTEDALFEGSQASYRGRDEIRRFYQWREDRGARATLHVFSNVRVEITSNTTATCTWYMRLYAADGVPVLPTHPPIQIAVVTDACVRADGGWLWSHRRFEPWFEGGLAVTNPQLTEARQ